MPLYRLAKDDIVLSAGWPEFAMGVQIVVCEIDGREVIGVVLGDLVFMTRDEESYRQLSELFREPWSFKELLAGYGALPDATPLEGPEPRENPTFYSWWRRLPEAGLRRALTGPQISTWLTANYMPPRPARPRSLYGHLPYSFDAGQEDVFYRYEAWPVSRRIHRSLGQIDKGTFACPASEKRFVRCGFAAVGRYALPDLMPACWRWKLKPAPGSLLDIGACVPLYGQAGGGVEVCFRNDTTTREPISLPRILPIY